MNIKFSEDVIPLSSVKVNPGKLVKQTGETHRPVLLTSRGKGVAVLQSLEDFEKAEEERRFMRAVMQGNSEIDAGQGISVDEVKLRLGL
ncbi:MAG: prevent-host-death family protein [Zetaproteobacteria bacterium CG_4_9_14_3_um_filter_53_7]|nr:MAG: prevent-host-death family protein [Zetaproteobacteria bacterium CG_4_9_14_3_um_filter_53_7]